MIWTRFEKVIEKDIATNSLKTVFKVHSWAGILKNKLEDDSDLLLQSGFLSSIWLRRASAHGTGKNSIGPDHVCLSHLLTGFQAAG